MDASLYESLPGFVTSLHALEVPRIPDQQLQFPSGESLTVAAGATICKSSGLSITVSKLIHLVFSGARNFELLSQEEQTYALNTTVQYAPRAYEWIRNCKASADGLTIPTPGREAELDQLAEWTWEEAQSFPVI